MVGYMEVLTWILCSSKEISTMLNREDDKTAAINGNPRSADFEVQSTSDLPHVVTFLLKQCLAYIGILSYEAFLF